MALIKCPDCGADVSDIAHACPKCGRPISAFTRAPSIADTTRIGSAKAPKVPVRALLAMCVLAVIGLLAWLANYRAEDLNEATAPVQRAQSVTQPAFRPGMYETPDEIANALAGFKTFDGRPLQTVLADLGLKVSSILVSTVESGAVEGDRAGDVSYDVTMVGKLKPTIPCENMRPAEGIDHPVNMEEILRREGQFPVTDEEGAAATGPTLFWAATGRCSKAY